MSDATAHAAHPPHLAHHFNTPKQQFESGKLGMWLFLATEVLMFGGLFCAYAIYRGNHPEIFAYGSQFLDVKWGAINTMILIGSSFTMALAVRAAQLGQQKLLVAMLTVTILCAFGFMGIKYVEYSHKISHGLMWGKNYAPQAHAESHGESHGAAQAEPHAATESVTSDGHAEAPAAPVDRSAIGPAATAPTGLAPPPSGEAAAPVAPPNVHIFFGIYFAMTGLHGIHVLGGIVVISWLLVGALGGRFGPGYFTPVDLVGLYWHIVDLIWIFLFPLLYLI
jgi:cytochrome c oxidase subunit 3